MGRSIHHWHLAPRAPRWHGLHLSDATWHAIRDVVVLLVCAMLAGGLAWRLNTSAVGPLAPAAGGVRAGA